MRQLFIIVLLLHFHHVFAQPQVIVNDNCKAAYQNILALKFDDARHQLAIEKDLNPDNVYIDFLENALDFMSVFISEDESVFNALEVNKGDRIESIKRLDKESPFRDYMLGNIHFQWAVARIKFKEYFTAAIEINRAYRLLKSNTERFPDFAPNMISLGVLHIMIGLVPDKYHWVLTLVNMEGNVEQGKEELRYVLEQSKNNEIYRHLKNEVLFYLGFVELNIHPDKERLDFLLSQIQMAKKNNLMLSYLSIKIHMLTSKNELALLEFEDLPDLRYYYPFYFLKYLEGECNLRKLNTNVAFSHFEQFITNFKGQSHIKDAYRKMAWAKLLDGDTISYKRLIANALETGKDNTGVDSDALREAKSEQLPNVELVKVRLLFDGGYFQQADSVLFRMDTMHLRKDDTIERIYRKARIAHESGKIEKAKLYYDKTIEIGKTSERYFAGNSAYKLGEIFETEENYARAGYYYELCLDMDFDEYESGIHSKAKAGLKRVSD